MKRLVAILGLLLSACPVAARPVLPGQVAGIVALPAATPLPAAAGTPVVAIGTSKLVAAYTGASVRVQCGSTITQTDVAFDPSGYADVPAARAFCGSGVELRIVTGYDQSGNARNATGSATSPSVLPILTTMRDAWGPAFPAYPVILHQGLIYPYPANTVAGLALPASVSVDQQNMSVFDVAAPNASMRLTGISTVGGNTGSSRSNFVTQPGSPYGLQTFQYDAGSTLTIQSNGTGGNPRVGLQVLNLNSSSAARTLWCEDVSASLAVSVSKALTGGALGGGPDGSSTAWYTGLRTAFVLYTALSDANSLAVRGALSTSFGTAKRLNRVILVGSSTPEGRGPNNQWPNTYSTHSYFPLALGRLDRQVDGWGLGISGRVITDVTNNLSNETTPYVKSGSNNIGIPDVGGNTLKNSGSASSAYADYKSLISAMRSAGFNYILAVTFNYRSDIANSLVDSLNSMIRSGKADLGYDGLIDFDAGANAGSGLVTNPNFVADTDGTFVHTVNGPHLLRAIVAAAAIQKVLQ